MKKILILAAFLLTGACENAPNAYVAEPFAFEAAQAAPMRVNVAQIKLVEDYKSPARRPNMEQEFPVPPAAAVKKWVGQRLQASGNSGAMEVIITDASVKEVRLPKTQGIKGVFTDDQEVRMDARLAVTFRLYSGARTLSDATGDVIITRSRTINERATVFEREKIYHAMTRDMMVSFDSESNARLRQYFSPFLR